MYLHALSTALPPARYTQPQCWGFVESSTVRERLSRRSALTLQAILRMGSGVETRHFAAPNVETIFDRNPDELNEIFRSEAPKLAARAIEDALAKAGCTPAEVDALIITTCTGYLCPGVTSYVAEQMGLRAEIFLQDLVGLGCGAAVPGLRAADAFLAANPRATVVTVSVEICSAAFYLDDDLGVIVSACLFGDGAAAAVWRRTPAPHSLKCHGFRTLHVPEKRDMIRFEQRNGKLRNLLDASVPTLAAEAVTRLLKTERENAGPVREIVSHGGGRDVLDALERALPEYSFQAARDVLRRCGNMSSPSCLFALEEKLRSGRPDDTGDWWLVTFGAGFSVHSCRLSAE
jgi:predicted naringenin-chalcone synthase